MADKSKKHSCIFRGGYDNKLYNTPIYRSWYNMKTRCLNKKVPFFDRYGGRGISICEKWLSFKGFLEDMGPSFKDGLTIDRIDNNGNYYKENCRWATKKEQANNTKNTEIAKRYSFNGFTRTVSEWAKEYNLKRRTLDMRLRICKWSINRALTTKVS